MSDARAIIDAITTADEATAAVESIPKLDHALTSKKEASALLAAKATELGFTFDKKTKRYQEAQG